LVNGVVNLAEAEKSTGERERIAVSSPLGDAELVAAAAGMGLSAAGGLGWVAKPLLVPLMINITATANTVDAPNTSPRRAQ
jgi:hypothetical protein